MIPEPALDTNVLGELVSSVGDDRGFVVDLAQTFLTDAADLVGAIEGATAAADVETLVRAAHTLKSSSATLGCLHLAAIARGIELAGREGRIDSSVTDGRLRQAWTEASDALAGWAEGQ